MHFLLLLLYIPFFLKVQNNKIIQTSDINFKEYLEENSLKIMDEDSQIHLSKVESFAKRTALNSMQISEPTEGIDNTFNDRVSVFPNPVSDKLTVRLLGADRLKGIRVSSLGGRMFETNKLTIDFSNLPKRIYLLEIKNTENEIATKVIIKN